MDDPKGYTVTQVSVGGDFDGSQFVQSLADLPSDTNKVMYHCPPLTVQEQRNVIRYIYNSSIYCQLAVTHNMRLYRQFVTVERNGKLYVSSWQFPHSGAASGEGDLHCLHCIGWPPRLPYLKWFSSLVEDWMQRCLQYQLFPVKSPDNQTTWKISFFTIENMMIQYTWTSEERKAYSLFKCLVKKHVCLPKSITSYILKNIMFLAHDRLQWISCIRYEIHLLGVLDDLMHRLVEGNLPMYFARGVNLLADISANTLMKAARKVSILRQTVSSPLQFSKAIGNWSRNIDVQIMKHYALVNIRRHLNEGKLVELGDLHVNPHTVLFIWES